MCTRGVKGRGVKEGSWGGKRCPSGRLYAHPTTPSPAHTFHPSLLRPPLSIHVHGGFTRSTVSPPISAVSLTSALAQASFPSSLRASLSILVHGGFTRSTASPPISAVSLTSVLTRIDRGTRDECYGYVTGSGRALRWVRVVRGGGVFEGHSLGRGSGRAPLD